MTQAIDLAILAALDEEVESLRSNLAEPHTESAGAFNVLRGRLQGCKVIVGRTY